MPHSHDILHDLKDSSYNSNNRERIRDVDLRYDYRDRERELFEWECDREKEFEQALASPVLKGHVQKVVYVGPSVGYSDADDEDWC